MEKKTKLLGESSNRPHYSTVGTHRNQGYIGQTGLSRYLGKTPMKNSVPRGHGGNLGKYNKTAPAIVSPNGIFSVENSNVLKSASLSYNGMVATKYRWAKRPAPITTIKPDSNQNNNFSSAYTGSLTKNTIQTINKSCPTTILSYYNQPLPSCANNTTTASYMKSHVPSDRRKRFCSVVKPDYLISAQSQGDYIAGGAVSLCKASLPSGEPYYMYFGFENNGLGLGTITKAGVGGTLGANGSYSADTYFGGGSSRSLASTSLTAPFALDISTYIPSFEISLNMTFSFYVKTTVANIVAGTLFSMTDTVSGKQFAINIATNGKIAVGNQATGEFLTSITGVNDGAWHKIILYVSSRNASIYVDDALDNIAYGSFPDMTGTYSGGTKGFFSNMTGFLDDFKVYASYYPLDFLRTIANPQPIYNPYISAYSAYDATRFLAGTGTWVDATPNNRSLTGVVSGVGTDVSGLVVSGTEVSAVNYLSLTDYGAISQLLGSGAVDMSDYTVFYVSRV